MPISYKPQLAWKTDKTIIVSYGSKCWKTGLTNSNYGRTTPEIKHNGDISYKSKSNKISQMPLQSASSLKHMKEHTQSNGWVYFSHDSNS